MKYLFIILFSIPFIASSQQIFLGAKHGFMNTKYWHLRSSSYDSYNGQNFKIEPYSSFSTGAFIDVRLLSFITTQFNITYNSRGFILDVENQREQTIEYKTLSFSPMGKFRFGNDIINFNAMVGINFERLISESPFLENVIFTDSAEVYHGYYSTIHPNINKTVDMHTWVFGIRLGFGFEITSREGFSIFARYVPELMLAPLFNKSGMNYIIKGNTLYFGLSFKINKADYLSKKRIM